MDAALSLALPRDPQAASIARCRILRGLRDTLSDRALDDVMIVASELVNNAVIHGAGDIALRIAAKGEVLRVAVQSDATPSVARIRMREPGTIGGWGLRIVDRLSVKWGTSEPGVVWADLPVN
jgi:anti-sigma regulatory factor (Ser/Thr protein kinase)